MPSNKIIQVSKDFDSVNFFDIKLYKADKIQLRNRILDFANSNESKFITYLNAHCANIFFDDLKYKKILQKADLVYSEGQGVVWASRFLDLALPERLNILDFFDDLVSKFNDKKITIYLLGDSADIVKKTAERLKSYYNLEVLGFHNGFFDEVEETSIIQEINRLKPNILLVGMGVPRQEKWIHANIDKLDVNLCWAVGGAFNWLSGERKRAPWWMRHLGLEWFHRLIQEPKRLWKRYLIGNIVFIFRVFRYKIRAKNF